MKINEKKKLEEEKKETNKIGVPIRHILRDSPGTQASGAVGTPPPGTRASGAVGPPPESHKMNLSKCGL